MKKESKGFAIINLILGVGCLLTATSNLILGVGCLFYTTSHGLPLWLFIWLVMAAVANLVFVMVVLFQ